jgi:hypothetical protein
MRNIVIVGVFLAVMFASGVSAETFSASFVETCIGCLDDVAPEATPVIGSINLPAGRINMTIDTKVNPYYGMGSVSCIANFLYTDLGADLVAWPNSRTAFIQGRILESTVPPCVEKAEHREHFVTQLVLKKPVKFDVIIVPSIEHNNLGPKFQYGQTKSITVSYTELGLCSIIGTYAWFNGRTVYIRSDNTIEVWSGSTKEMRGTWTKSGGVYILNWINDATGDKYVDTLTTSDDCQSVSGSNSQGLSISGTKTSDAAPEMSSATPKVTEKINGVSNVISDNWNKAVVGNNPSCKPSFTIYESQMITYVDTYHWNDGKGTSVGGTISLKKDDGTIYGPWKVSTKPGMGGVPNAWWIVYPNEVIPAGKYTVEDSDTATWSQNSGSKGCGFSKIEGMTYVQTTVLPTPTPILTSKPITTQMPTSTQLPIRTSVIPDRMGSTPTVTQTPRIVPCTNYWGPIEPLRIAEAAPRQSPGTYALLYTEIPKSSGDPRNWVWKLYGNVILKGGNRYFIIFGGSDIPQFFEETNLPSEERLVTATQDTAIIWDENDNTKDLRYAYCFRPVTPPVVTKSPNVGIIGIIPMVLVVYVLLRKK